MCSKPRKRLSTSSDSCVSNALQELEELERGTAGLEDSEDKQAEDSQIAVDLDKSLQAVSNVRFPVSSVLTMVHV